MSGCSIAHNPLLLQLGHGDMGRKKKLKEHVRWHFLRCFFVFCVFFFKCCHADVCSTVYFSAVVIWAFGSSSIASVNIEWGGKVMSYTADSQQGALGVLSRRQKLVCCWFWRFSDWFTDQTSEVGRRDVGPTWNMILYCSSGRLTTHMLQPMMASNAWRLCRLFRGS